MLKSCQKFVNRANGQMRCLLKLNFYAGSHTPWYLHFIGIPQSAGENILRQLTPKIEHVEHRGKNIHVPIGNVKLVLQLDTHIREVVFSRTAFDALFVLGFDGLQIKYPLVMAVIGAQKSKRGPVSILDIRPQE